ncbi:MAG: Histidine kinase [Pseudonocardiales bacterium]|nr:Histidine kinase [Pseudonocardiales bacterium]
MLLASLLVAVVIAASFTVLIERINVMSRSIQAASDSEQILAIERQLERLVLQVETGERGYLLTGDNSYLAPWQAAQASIPQLSVRLEQLARLPLPAQYSRSAVNATTAYINDYSIPLVADARRHDPSVRSLARLNEGERRIDGILASFASLDATERALVSARQERVLDASRIAIVAVVGGLVASVLLVALFAAYLSRAMVRPIRRAAKLARTLADGDLSARMPETGVGEIGGLEKSFNEMARSLEMSRDDLSQLAQEQGALRRVATLVAQGQPPAAIFNAVTEELARLLHATNATLVRIEPDGSRTVMARFGADDDGQPSAPNDEPGQSSAGAQIIVNGNPWGDLTATALGGQRLPQDAATRVANFTDLVATAIANTQARTELAASRARIVTTSDQTRRKIERDLHDGTQQRLTSLGLDLRLLETEIPHELPQVRDQLSRLADGLSGAMNDLREISRGIHPAILSEGGLGPALRALGRRSAIPVNVDVDIAAPIPQAIEIAAYYVATEALANCTKHAGAAAATVVARTDDSVLHVSVHDDGIGGADPTHGSGLVGLIDRIEAFGGTLKVTSPMGGGTAVRARIPLAEPGGVG